MAMDIELALRAMDDDRQLLEQLAVIFSEDAPRIASEFEHSVNLKNSKSARMAIHSLKGLVASFFDQEVVDEFASLERLCAEENWMALNDAPEEVFARVRAIIVDMLNVGLLVKSSK